MIAVASAVTVICALAVLFDRPALLSYTDTTAPTYRRPTPKQVFTPPAGQPKPAAPPNLSWMGPGLQKLFIAMASIVLLIAFVVLAIAITRALRNRRRRAKSVAEPLPPVRETFAESIESSLDDLSVGSPDNAIIRCWVGLQTAAATAGIEPRPSETAAELTLRLLDDLPVDREAVGRLAALYREARFSSHPLSETDRDAARDALATIRDGLGSRAVSHG